MSATPKCLALLTVSIVLLASAEGQTPVPLPSSQPMSASTVAASAATPTPFVTDPALITRTLAGKDIPIGSGDLIEVRVFGTDYAKTSRVSETGDAALPLVGSVHVGGLTTKEARDVITRDLVKGELYREPQVSVFIKEYSTQRVTIVGEVAKPGMYPRLGEHRLLDLISSAGGFTPKAGKLITITHRGETTPAATVEYIGGSGQQISSNLDVQPGDTVYVSPAGVVYVLGNVNRPSGFVMDNHGSMSVLEALAMAGGTTPHSSLNSAKVIRRTPEGMQEIPVPLNKILGAKSEDLALQAGDVLFIPGSVTSGVFQQSAASILQTATGVAVYQPAGATAGSAICIKCAVPTTH